MSTIYVYSVSAGYVVLSLNGREVGGLGPNEYTWFHVPVGTQVASVLDASGSGRTLATTNVECAPGAVHHLKYLRLRQHPLDTVADSIAVAVTGDNLVTPPKLVPVGPLEARALLARSKLVGTRFGDSR